MVTVESQPKENYLTVEYGIRSWLPTTDHKRIALLYLVSIAFFFCHCRRVRHDDSHPLAYTRWHSSLTKCDVLYDLRCVWQRPRVRVPSSPPHS
jgi:hypothetical protein